MKVYDATSLRNVAIVGHGGSGKTQLVSTMLFVAGAVNRIGRVDDGTTVTDFDEEEIARKHTLSSSLAYAEWQKAKINIIDTSPASKCKPRSCGARPPRSDCPGSSS
jgi:elongation factor G